MEKWEEILLPQNKTGWYSLKKKKRNDWGIRESSWKLNIEEKLLDSAKRLKDEYWENHCKGSIKRQRDG